MAEGNLHTKITFIEAGLFNAHTINLKGYPTTGDGGRLKADRDAT